MAWYSYFCEQCHYEDIDQQFMPLGQLLRNCQCPLCGGRMRRGASFNFNRPMREHYNHSVGQFVGNERQFKDGLKRKSEEMSMRTGMEHNYQPVDVTDMKALGVTDEGLEHTRKVHHDKGLTNG